MNFKRYANYYDHFYKKKDYKGEIKKIHKIVNFKKRDKVLEVGCGTGKHTLELIKYIDEIDAIDKSKKMLSQARKIRKQIRNKNKINFYNTEAIKLGRKKYDKIVLFFHVFSYFIDNNYILKTFKKFHKILNSGGLVIFDYWNSDYIKKFKLRDSSRKIFFKKNSIKRAGKIEKIKKNVFQIRYSFRIEKNKKIKKFFNETHIMRSFEKKDIIRLSKNLFTIKKLIRLDNLKKVSSKDFSACVVLKKID
tara:strand:+ start:9429 stop:10175 length:747 start_codon:yes stop_codon:yes gene_type:complete